MNKADHYSALGVLPSAGDVVISAAYKVLASKYHPDKFQGNTEYSHKRMSEINEAYRVLRDRESRNQYDRDRLK